MITFCTQCGVNIDTADPCNHRKSLLRKLRVYSNKINEVTAKLESGDIDENEANNLATTLDEYYATRIDQMYPPTTIEGEE